LSKPRRLRRFSTSDARFALFNIKRDIAITGRSRDNFPNPVATVGNPYVPDVPANSPAIDDLFSTFRFDDGGNGGSRNDDKKN
jgi:hypothetical protein